MAVHFGGFSSAAADNWAASRGLSRSPIAVAIMGQSNERGQVDPTEAIGGVFFAVAVYVERGGRRRRFPSVFHDFTPDNYGSLDLNKSKEPP